MWILRFAAPVAYQRMRVRILDKPKVMDMVKIFSRDPIDRFWKLWTVTDMDCEVFDLN